MDELSRARAEIDQVDAQMAQLFERRMRAVRSIAQYKQQHGLPILDADRERQVLERSVQRIQDPELRPLFQEFITLQMSLSRRYQAGLTLGNGVQTEEQIL